MFGGLQQHMESLKEQAAQTEVVGQSGGGLVKVVANGALQITSVRIDPSALDDREMLEDLLTAAANDAMRQAQAIKGQQVASMMGGLPPGML